MTEKYDLLILGGGIVGLATALNIQQQRPNLRMAVLEKEAQVARHQSSRNSGVIHSGIYYRPGSLRATNCRRGYDLLLDFCTKNAVPFDICGKVIVAVNDEERSRLDGILQNGIQNGLTGIRRISASEVRELEPHVQAVEAIHVPQAGIIDYGVVAGKYAELLKAGGADILTGRKVIDIRPQPDRVVVETETESFSARLMVNCAGLYADRLARMSGVEPGVQVLPFRGEFYELLPHAERLVRNLVYPVPNPNFPFLGVHFTRMIGGGIEAGPNAVLAYCREGYHKSDIHAGELLEILSYPGFHRIARKYWRDGWLEFQRSYSKRRFLAALQRLIPEIGMGDIESGRSGVRAMACGQEGALLDDFLILERPHMVHVVNAPSPAATASLAVGETVARKALEQLN